MALGVIKTMNAKTPICTVCYRDDLIQQMKSTPFSICIDGSNDQGLEKMYPILVKLWDVNKQKTKDRFLDICTMKGKDSSTAEGIIEMCQF